MEYRAMKSLDIHPSLLGFGCMRFPTLADGTIDEPQAAALLERAFAAGVNYFDTAYFYHNGASENYVNRILARHPRDSYYLTSKLPTVLVHSLEDAQQIYAQQRARLERDYLDFYLMHNLNGARWRALRDNGVMDWYLSLRDKGEFRYTGFSFHGSYEEFEEILTARAWDVCQIQFNYMDTDEQAGLKGYQLAERLGIPVIIMEPVKGGALAAPPAEVLELFCAAAPAASPASWAIRWCAGFPGVMTVLSGMSTMEQVEDNLASFSPFRPMDGHELQVVAQAAERFKKRVNNGCTGCSYCMPCPAGVDIPGNFKIWNQFGVYQNARRAAEQWKELSPQAKAASCVSCGQCLPQCPQGLPIPADLKRAREALDTL